jgi:predicted flap endonuclease-1-like 5' DNA nuclease
MHDMLWFVVGVLVGAGLAWFWLERKVTERQNAMEANYEGRLKHLQDEVRRADQAHEETKAMLRELIAQRGAAGGGEAGAAAELERARSETERARAEARRLGDEIARLEAQLRERPAPAPLPAAAAAAAPPPAPVDARAQRLRAIDAKLKMLPAGSSARAALLAERSRLLGGDSPVTAAAELPAAPAGAEPDDLEVIKGIGPVIHAELKRMGIVTFAQLVSLTPEQIERIEEAIGFPGRVSREHWIEQARARLAQA